MPHTTIETKLMGIWSILSWVLLEHVAHQMFDKSVGQMGNVSIICSINKHMFKMILKVNYGNSIIY